jgi:hypothetical protein
MRQIKYKDGTMTIIAGDFNCHHPRWNPTSYTRHDDTANDLVELATEFGLDLLLPSGTVTYTHAETAIDLVWGCSKAQERVLKCQIASQCDQGSDHWPVETILSAKDNRTSETPSYNISKANWPKFHKVLVTHLTAQTTVPQGWSSGGKISKSARSEPEYIEYRSRRYKPRLAFISGRSDKN